MTAPVSVHDLCLTKLLLAAGISLLAQGCIGALFLISGKIAGIQGFAPPELPEWLLLGALGGIAVCSVQLFLSLLVRAFAPPVAAGLVGGIFGLLCTAQGLGYGFPYSLLCLGMRANDPKLTLELFPFVCSCLLYTVVFLFLSIWFLNRRDVSQNSFCKKQRLSQNNESSIWYSTVLLMKPRW